MIIKRSILFLLLGIGFYTSWSQEHKNINTLLQQADALVYDDPNRSLELSEEARDLALAISNDSLVAEATFRIGSAYWSKGDLSLSLDALNKAQQLLKGENNPVLYGNILKRLGTLCSGIGDQYSALEYYLLSAIQYEKGGSELGLVGAYNNIGNAYRELRQFDSALFYVRSAQIRIQSDMTVLAPIINFNVGEVYYDSGRLDLALPYIEHTKELSQQRNDKRGVIRSNQLLAEINLQSGEVASARNLAEEAVSMARKTASKELIAISERTLANVLYASGQYQRAFQYQQEAAIYFDSIASSENQARLNFYQVKQVQEQLDLLKKEQAISQLQARNSKITLIGIAIIAILAIALAWLFYRGRESSALNNQVLAAKNKEIESQKQELKKLSDLKSRILAILTHDMKSPFQGLFGIITLIEKGLASGEEVERFISDLKIKVSHSYKRVADLLQWATLGMEGGADVDKTDFSISDTASKAIEELQTEAHLKGITFVSNIPTGVVAVGDQKLFESVLRNLLSNALKFSSNGDEVSLNILEKNDDVIIAVKDEGMGMSESESKSLFKSSQTPGTGSEGEVGSGVGLVLCRDLLQEMNGRIWVESKEGEGSEFFVSLAKPDVKEVAYPA